MSPISSWDIASERHVVEPLLIPIDAWQKEKLGFSVFEKTTNHPFGAEVLIPELVNKIDGALELSRSLPTMAFHHGEHELIRGSLLQVVTVD